MASSKIRINDLDETLIAFLENLAANSGGGKLEHAIIEATTEGQTVFEIPIEGFDSTNDYVLVQDGYNLLPPGVGFTVNETSITVTEPWSLGDGGCIYVLKGSTNSGNSGGGIEKKDVLFIF